MQKFTKQPADVLDFDIEMEDWLDGDEITSCTVTTPDGITLDSKTLFDERVKLWFSGGTDGEEYKISALIVTLMGRSKEIDFKIRVKER